MSKIYIAVIRWTIDINGSYYTDCPLYETDRKFLKAFTNKDHAVSFLNSLDPLEMMELIVNENDVDGDMIPIWNNIKKHCTVNDDIGEDSDWAGGTNNLVRLFHIDDKMTIPDNKANELTYSFIELIYYTDEFELVDHPSI